MPLKRCRSGAISPANLEAGLLRLREADPQVAALLAPRAAEVSRLLNVYIDEIERFNPIYGLVGARNREELVIKHILDSLSPLGILCGLLDKPAVPQVADVGSGAGLQGKPAAPQVADVGSGAGLQGKPAAPQVADVGSGAGLQGRPAAYRVADVGSGAGLPGIPLAIALPDVEFTLIERMTRRANFLRGALAVLGLPNAAVEEADMERAQGGRFDLVVFRAFRPLEPAVLTPLLRLLAGGGVLVAYKGRRETLEEELAKAAPLLGRREILPCPVPFLDEERHLALLGRR